MMRMTRMIMALKTIRVFLIVEGAVLATSLYSKLLFANAQVAFLTALLVIVGSSFAYKKMVDSKVSSEEYSDERDLLDTIEDPHELYDENTKSETAAEELDFKAIVKEEKAKIKTFSFKSIKHGARGSVSLFRILPYIFLILGFIALKNNNLLDLSFYLPSLLIGIVVGSLLSKDIAS
jgi:hypothetical protein